MKITAADFADIRRSLLLFLAFASVGGGAVLAAARFATVADYDYRQARAQHAELRAQLFRAGQEETALRTRVDRYRDMVGRAIFGPEQRAEWIEHVAKIAQLRRLGTIRYELGPQKPALLPGGNTAGNYEFMASTMQLHLSLLHEIDLLDFLADVAVGAPAFPRVRSCKLAHSTDGEQDAMARLQAECSIDWITVRERT